MDESGNCAGETEISIDTTSVKWLLYHNLGFVLTIEEIVRVHEIYFRGLVLNLSKVFDVVHQLSCCDGKEEGCCWIIFDRNSMTVDGFCIWFFLISADKHVLPMIESGL